MKSASCIRRFIIFWFFSLLFVGASQAQAYNNKDKITVVYLGSNHPAFWAKTRQFASAVADDLDIVLRFKTGENRFGKLEAMQDLLTAPNKPDYLVFSYTKNVGVKMMTLADQAGIPFILINSDIPKNERRFTGRPREKFSHWLGHMYPNDRAAGYLLADLLLKKAHALDKKPPLKVVGVGGHLMEAGWALVLLHDYHHDMDFQNEPGTTIHTEYSVATDKNIRQLQVLFRNNNWRHIDYREFSKVHTPDLDRYRLNAEEMLRLFPSSHIDEGHDTSERER